MSLHPQRFQCNQILDCLQENDKTRELHESHNFRGERTVWNFARLVVHVLPDPGRGVDGRGGATWWSYLGLWSVLAGVEDVSGRVAVLVWYVSGGVARGREVCGPLPPGVAVPSSVGGSGPVYQGPVWRVRTGGASSQVVPLVFTSR